jgi:alkylation response protein AidB-like acyl-CoA dehydrogenase
VLRKLIRTFGMDEMARSRFTKQLDRAEAGASKDAAPSKGNAGGRGDAVAMQLIPIIELCRYCPGMVTAMGVSMGLAGSAIMSKGTRRQKERWALDLLTLDKIGAWAITEPGSGSDAFGAMKSSARRDGDGGYVLNGNKTFITNGPYADTIVFICKLDEEGVDTRDRKVLTFVLDKGMPGLTQSKPMRKMGLHSSPTGELFLQDVVATADRLLGETEESRARSGTKDSFSMERTGVVAMALGIVDRCLELSLSYARERVQFDRPIGEFQLIQDKLARMEVARMNLQNLVFRQIEMASQGRATTLAEASAMKLYAARAATEVALEAVQVYGGNGYMSEYQVEQLARDAKVLQIYAGTDEIQISAIARELLAG